MISPQEALKHIPTWKWHEVIQMYAKKSNYKNALDIGTAMGFSAWSVAQHGTGKIISIDIKGNKDARRYASDYGYADRIVFLNDGSDDFFEKNEETFDLIVVDGDHKRQGCYRDVCNAWKFLNTGGYMVCDDYQHPRLLEDVGWAIDKFAKERSLKGFVINKKIVFQK